MRGMLLHKRSRIFFAILGLCIFVLFSGYPSGPTSSPDPIALGESSPSTEAPVYCVMEREPSMSILAPSRSGCSKPKKVSGLWDQGDGQYCYLVSVLNSNIMGGVDDSSNQFYNAMLDCMRRYGVNICDLQNGVDTTPGSFYVEIINSCKILTRDALDEPIGLDFYRLKRPWWDWSSEVYSVGDLCGKINNQIKSGGGAWASIGGLANGGSHEVSIVKAIKNSAGDSCVLTISDPNDPHRRTRITVDSNNKIKKIEPMNNPNLAEGNQLEDLTIESRL